jgi:MoaA/NifB/PqqE/SkfB family radical SAM enzyme
MNKKIIHNITSKFPTLSKVGYNILSKYWELKSKFINYEYEGNENSSISKKEIEEYNANRIFGPQKRFCYAPYNNLHFNINGDVGLCSFNNKLTIGNIKDDTLENIWKNQNASTYRNMMTNYDLSRCLECKLAFSFKNYSSLPTTKYDYHADNNIIFPNQMSFEISDLCNLECIMCNENLSSSIRKKKGLEPIKNPYNYKFLEQLKPFIPNLKIATFIGGEPLLIKLYYSIWEEIIKTNPTCEIHVQTNATILPNKFLKLLNTGKFDIGVSLDAITEKKFESIRIKSNHKEIFDNVSKLIKLYNNKLINLNINFCLMNNNWEELPLMLNFCNFHNIALKIIHINSPMHLDIKNLHYKDIEKIYFALCSYKIQKNKTHISTRNINTFNDAIRNIKNYIEYSKLIYTFLESYNKKDLKSLITEISELIQKDTIFNSFSNSDKNEIFYIFTNYLDSIEIPKQVKERICMRFIYHITQNEHVKVDYIDKVTFIRILEEYCQIELIYIQ